MKKPLKSRPTKKFTVDKDEKPQRKRRYYDETEHPANKRKGSRKPGGFLEKKNFQQNIIIDDGLVRLNKYIANAGICSRREADKIIVSGAVTVNGEVVTELGTKVSTTDVIRYGGQKLRGEKKKYLLLNKSKGYITTVDDPDYRDTVMMLIRNACNERIYPVGRLDRNSTGVLLFTNDGELAKKLTHPKYQIKKIYQVGLDKPLTKNDLNKIIDGIELDDGPIRVDKIAFVGEGKDKKQIGIELHSGRNRIVRRIFETLDYKVVKLDRVAFAGLTKKDVPRGKWRFLSVVEVNILKRLK